VVLTERHTVAHRAQPLSRQCFDHVARDRHVGHRDRRRRCDREGCPQRASSDKADCPRQGTQSGFAFVQLVRKLFGAVLPKVRHTVRRARALNAASCESILTATVLQNGMLACTCKVVHRFFYIPTALTALSQLVQLSPWANRNRTHVSARAAMACAQQ